MPRVRVGDVRLFYEARGAGEPLLLVMGFGGDHLAWGFQAPAFAERHRVIAFDNRGAGRSDVPDVRYTTRAMAEDALGLLDALGVERAHVLGVSMGGMIAQELALAHPDRVLTLQLHCTCARPDRYLRALIDTWRTVRRRLEITEWMRALALWLFSPRTYQERPDLVETIVQMGAANPFPFSLTGFLRQGEAIRDHDALDRLGAIACPTLVTVADDDILVPPRFAREIAARVPGAVFRTVPDAGHAYFWERPDVFNAMCLEFLAAHAGR
ncbi:MAG TPA: alpha/beta fold hydrolase [Candidatus Tectomicrobia bacterium]|nr:alpha/beta fold hydrolase [Candidatus Tectomicrobia bacterium]